MSDPVYTLPENPTYHEEIRRLQRSDPADAEDIFNPLIQAILENIGAIKGQMETKAEENAAVLDALRTTITQSTGGTETKLDAHTKNKDNPHEVDYKQTGADKAGSAAAVQANLTAHNTDSAAHADIRKAINGLGTTVTSTLEARIAQLESNLSSEISARQSLASRISSAESSLRRTSYFVTGTYNGSGSSNTQTISIGFQPRAVLVVAYRGYYEEQYDRTCVQLAVRGANAKLVSITSSGFSVKGMLNGDGSAENPYRYLAMA